MTNVISMDNFNASKREAVNLSESEKEDADMEAALRQSMHLMEQLEDAAEFDATTLYFTWRELTQCLIENCGWTAKELSKDIRDTQKELEEQS